MKTTLPAPGTSIVSLLASLSTEEIAAYKPDLKKPAEGEVILGPIPDEALRLAFMRSQIRIRVEEIHTEANTLNTAHETRHKAADFAKTECAPHEAKIEELRKELQGLNDHYELLSELMWASIRLHFGLRGETSAGVGLAEGPDGIVVVSLAKDDSDHIGIGIEIIEVGFSKPSEVAGLSSFIAGLFGRRRRKEPATPAGPAG